MLGLKPVKLMPARERVASALRKAIISRQIKEGDYHTEILEAFKNHDAERARDVMEQHLGGSIETLKMSGKIEDSEGGTGKI